MLVNIILYLLQLIQQLYQQNCWLINFICRYIPLKQWAYDDSHSPKYQKFKIDKLPLILNVEPWDYRDFMAYLQWRYPDDKPIKPNSGNFRNLLIFQKQTLHRISFCIIPSSMHQIPDN